MSGNSYLSNALYAADDKAEYDAGAKKILADKQVLAWILKYCVKEFKEYPICVIKDCIEETPEISKIHLFPRKTASEAITGMSDVDDVPKEGGIRYLSPILHRCPRPRRCTDHRSRQTAKLPQDALFGTFPDGRRVSRPPLLSGQGNKTR